MSPFRLEIDPKDPTLPDDLREDVAAVVAHGTSLERRAEELEAELAKAKAECTRLSAAQVARKALTPKSSPPLSLPPGGLAELRDMQDKNLEMMTFLRTQIAIMSNSHSPLLIGFPDRIKASIAREQSEEAAKAASMTGASPQSPAPNTSRISGEPSALSPSISSRSGTRPQGLSSPASVEPASGQSQSQSQSSVDPTTLTIAQRVAMWNKTANFE